MNLPTVPLARLGATRGYRFDADVVEINASVEVLDSAAFGCAWALQLWACPSAPAAGALPVGHCVAMAWLPALTYVVNSGNHVVSTVQAQPPAGARDYAMVLALVALSDDGPAEMHDAVVFGSRERFFMPRIVAPASYLVGEHDDTKLEVAGIENPRSPDNLSGTLSLELWALSEPYDGAVFDGHPVAGVILGSLEGGRRWSDLEFSLPCRPPSDRTWHPVLMLREWLGGGYLTRDFVNFAPVSAAPAPVVEMVEAAPMEPMEPPVPAPKSRKKTAADKVSINRASVDELVGVKGLPRAVAERIVAARPFANLDDVVGVKGMGSKLFAKLRKKLEL